MAIRNLAHAQRMLDNLEQQDAKPRDPREQDVKPAPAPGSYFVEFRRKLSSSEHVKTIATLIANAHALYEGWTQHVWAPPTRSHMQAAEMGIRWSSAPCRSAATTAVENYVLTALERLQERMRSCDLTSVGLEWERKYIARTAVEVYLYHLLNETGRSCHEMRQLDETPLDDAEEDR